MEKELKDLLYRIATSQLVSVVELEAAIEREIEIAHRNGQDDGYDAGYACGYEDGRAQS